MLHVGAMFSCPALPRSRDRGRRLGLATATGLRAGRSIPSQPRPCCLPEESVEALATRSAHEPNELENRLGHSGGAHDLRWDLAPAPSSSCAPPPDVTYAALAPLADYVAPALVNGYIAPARVALCSRDFSEASTPMVVGSLLRSEGIAAPVFSQVHQEQIVAW